MPVSFFNLGEFHIDILCLIKFISIYLIASMDFPVM